MNKNALFFFFFWLLLGFGLKIYDKMVLPPLSVHQSAQTDRACIAYNFYKGDMNLFKPKVSDHRHMTGIVGCEFPIVNYLAAVSYKVFGFNDAYYRIIMWIIMSFGAYAAFLTSLLFIKNKSLSLVVTFIWYLSPILVYYSANFIPDTASLSCAMIGIYYFFNIFKNGYNNKKLILMIVFFSLAGLIKITSLIAVISALAIILFGMLFKKNWFTKNKWMLLGVFVPFLITISWYVYANYLNHKYGSTHFLMHAPRINDVEDFKKTILVFFNNWWIPFYPIGTMYLFYAAVILLLYKVIKERKAVHLFGILLLLGSISFYVIMAKQFMYHDYYLICLYPFILFLLISVVLWMKEFKYFLPKVIVVILLFVVANYSFHRSKEHLRSRYTPENYWYMTNVEPDNYFKLKEKIKKAGLDTDTTTFVYQDPTPNSILYFTELRGFRFGDQTEERHIAESIPLYKPRYILVNDSAAYLKLHPESVKLELLLREQNVLFYEVKY